MIPIPVADENPTSRTPFVNLLLIAVNGAVFVWFNVLRGEHFLQMSEADLQEWGLSPAHPDPLRFLTSMFLHGSPMHILGNMWFLHLFGDNVEDKLGHFRYLLLYLAWGVAAAFAFLWFGQPFGEIAGVPKGAAADMERLRMVGASGAISGVMGAYLVFFPRARIRLVWWLLLAIIPFTLPAFVVIGLYFLQDLTLAALRWGSASQDLGGVAYAAHTGGMVAGIVVALLMKPFLRKGADAAWDRDTGFVARGGGGPAPATRPSLDRSRAFPTGDLRDQVVGAVLDGRMDLALDLRGRWLAGGGAEKLPPGVEMELANELLRRGRVEDAEEAYVRFLGTHGESPQAPEAKLRLGLIASRATGDLRRAAEWLRQAASEHGDPKAAAFAREEIRRIERGA